MNKWYLKATKYLNIISGIFETLPSSNIILLMFSAWEVKSWVLDMLSNPLSLNCPPALPEISVDCCLTWTSHIELSAGDVHPGRGPEEAVSRINFHFQIRLKFEQVTVFLKGSFILKWKIIIFASTSTGYHLHHLVYCTSSPHWVDMAGKRKQCSVS